MATMNIKDPRVRELAMELAEMRGTSATAAVREALETVISQEKRRHGDFEQRIREIQDRVAASGVAFLTDDDMYDEHGLPR